jgi:hypothetical protein
MGWRNKGDSRYRKEENLSSKSLWLFGSFLIVFLFAVSSLGHSQQIASFHLASQRKDRPPQDTDLSEVRDFVEDQVGQAIYAFDKAAARGDIESVKKFIAEEYFHTDADGKVLDRITWLDNFKAMAAKLRAGDFKWDIYRSDRIQVQVLRTNLAVAIGRWTLKRSNGLEIKMRFTQVWIRRDNRWQRTAYQGTSIPDADKK